MENKKGNSRQELECERQLCICPLSFSEIYFQKHETEPIIRVCLVISNSRPIFLIFLTSATNALAMREA